MDDFITERETYLFCIGLYILTLQVEISMIEASLIAFTDNHNIALLLFNSRISISISKYFNFDLCLK